MKTPHTFKRSHPKDGPPLVPRPTLMMQPTHLFPHNAPMGLGVCLACSPDGLLLSLGAGRLRQLRVDHVGIALAALLRRARLHRGRHLAPMLPQLEHCLG